MQRYDFFPIPSKHKMVGLVNLTWFGFIEDNVLKQGKNLKSVTLDEMNSLWEDSKKYD